MNSETQKLQTHLDLLREEYVKLQSKLSDYEQKYENLLATAVYDREGSTVEEWIKGSFVIKLLAKVGNLFEKDLFSDIAVHIDGRQIKAHRLVLSVRSDHWGVHDLSTVDQLEFKGILYNVGIVLLKWVYTDRLDSKLDDGFLIDLMQAAKQFQLADLIDEL